MKTRRSQRLSKSLALRAKENRTDSDDSDSDGKEQKLYPQRSLLKNHSEDATGSAKIKANGLDKFIPTSKTTRDGDSSDSSDGFMKTPIDLNSDFFKVDFKKADTSDFSSIENKIFSGIQQLTDSENSSEFEDEVRVTEYIPIPLPGETVRKDVTNKFRKKSSKKNTEAKKAKPSTEICQKKVENGDAMFETKVIDSMDVSQLLALGETQLTTQTPVQIKIKHESEGEVSDWEEVKEEHNRSVKEVHSFPKEGVQITVDAPDLYHKRREKEFDMEAYMKRRMNRVKREIQILVHKVHLLCWIGHGLFVNPVLNSEVLMGLSLSLIPSQHCYPKTVNSNYLKQIAGWFNKTVPVKEVVTDKSKFISLHDSLQNQFECSAADSRRDLVFMFICLLRSLGLNARLVISLQPVPLKPSSNELCAVGLKKSDNQGRKASKGTSSDNDANKKVEHPRRKVAVKVKILSAKEAEGVRNKKVMSKEEAIKRVKKSSDSEKKVVSKNKKLKMDDNSNDKNEDAENPRRNLRVRKEVAKKYKDASDSSDGEDSECEPSLIKERQGEGGHSKNSVKKNTQSKRDSVKKAGINELSEKNEDGSPTCFKGPVESKESRRTSKNTENIQEEIPSKRSRLLDNCKPKTKKDVSLESTAPSVSGKDKKSIKQRRCEEKPTNTNTQSPSTSSPKKDQKRSSTNSGSDFEHEITEKIRKVKKGRPTSAIKEEPKIKKKPSNSDSDFEHELTEKIKSAKKKQSDEKVDRRVLSSDSDDDQERLKINHWTEVLLDDKTWVPINVISGNVDCVRELCSHASKPVTYIVAWNPDNTLKDITRRYCSKFHSDTRKQRVEEPWWREALFPFYTPNTALDIKEDNDMEKKIQDMPLPTSVGQYKNHPLYALKRHLLKFQAIYPPDAPPLGYVRGEPVFARECVHTLHSREIWLKEAKTVRLGEQPYKIVKARPKYDRMSGKVLTDLPLEIFGVWQVEEYVPPTAVDGKVPRNAYGNVELFKPTMLPKGTVHLQVPGLNRVAKKLGIDCAPAVVGFDFHCGASHPVYDGFVVCEEFQDVMLDAWNRDQEEAVRREQEKRDKRVYGNWRRLIKGLMIRERLNLKYSFGEETVNKKITKGKKGKTTTKKKIESSEEDDFE